MLIDWKIVISASIPIIGLFIGYWITSKSEAKKKKIEIRAQAYLDLINAISDIASTSNIQESKVTIAQLKGLISAKSKVVLLGSKDVVIEIQQFFTTHEKLESNSSFNDFSKIVSAMRKDLVGKSDFDNKLLTEALFGKE